MLRDVMRCALEAVAMLTFFEFAYTLPHIFFFYYAPRCTMTNIFAAIFYGAAALPPRRQPPLLCLRRATLVMLPLSCHMFTMLADAMR